MSIARMRDFTGPAILSYGFRPFFFLGSIYSALTILFWIPLFQGQLESYSAFHPVDWHAHEMLFGVLPAIATGFLLTAVPNWTGRLPVQGARLALLAGFWVIGRLGVSFSMFMGPLLVAILDNLFLASVLVAVGTEIFSGRNWRNLKVLVPLAILLAGNILFHLEAYLSGTSDIARRLGMAAIITLIVLIGGRIIPSFTRNWLVRANPGRLPAPFGRFDIAAVGCSILAFGLWIAMPQSLLTGLAMLAAAILHFVRLARWAGERTVREPLVLILHLAYFFVPSGFALIGLSCLQPDWVGQAAGLHAFGAGAAGTMTLAVMMRATLGHTGRALTMTRGAKLIFAFAFLAALTRVSAAINGSTLLIEISGLAWVGAFFGFAIVFGPALLMPRQVG